MQLILLLALAIPAISQQTDYTLSIKYTDSNSWIKVGELKIVRNNFQNAQVTLENQSTILDRKLLSHRNSASLQLQDKQTQKTYLAHIDGKQIELFNPKANYQEFIALVTSNNDLVAFDYALKSVRKHAETHVSVMVKELEVAPSENAPHFEEKAPETEEQKPQGIFGLIMQYKWYIIIGFVIFFMTAQADPQKLNETVQQAQQQAQQTAQRRRPR